MISSQSLLFSTNQPSLSILPLLSLKLLNFSSPLLSTTPKMQFSTIFTLAFFSVASTVMAQDVAGSQGACSTGTAQCCSSVHSGEDAKSLNSLLGLNDVAGDVGLSCQQIPVNAVGASVAASNSCKNTAVCCTGSEANALIQTSCTPLSVN